MVFQHTAVPLSAKQQLAEQRQITLGSIARCLCAMFHMPFKRGAVMLTLLSLWGIDAEELRTTDVWRVLLGGNPDLVLVCSESFFPAHADVPS